MNNPQWNDSNDLILRALHDKLSESEKREFARRLEQDAALQAAWAEEKGLEQVLNGLPNVPVSTNFTALVMEAVQADEWKKARSTGKGWFRFRFARVAAGLATVAIGGVLVLQQFRRSERNEMAQSVSAFTEVASVLSSEQTSPAVLFQDFEAIQQLSLPAESELDLELLVALQK